MTIDLTHDSAARTYARGTDPLDVEFATNNGVLHTLEGDVAFQQGDALLTGGAGERWPVQRAHFDEAYEAVKPTTQGQSGLYRRRPNQVLARQMSAPFDVPLGTRGTLHGKAGDWLVQYAPGDLAVVAQSIFEQTYTHIPDDAGRHD